LTHNIGQNKQEKIHQKHKITHNKQTGPR